MSEEILLTEDYLKILQERFKTKDLSFHKAEWCSPSKDIQGFMGEHYILKIHFQIGCIIHNETFFVKTKPKKNQFQKKAVQDLSTIYKKEVFFYNFLFMEYEKMGYYTKFAPKSFFSKGEETIVMENLQEQGYVVKDRSIFYDLLHCKELLKSLAYFHGNYLALEESKSAELGRCYRINQEYPEVFEEILYKEGDVESLGAKYISSSIKCMLALAKILPENLSWKESFAEKLKVFDYVKIMNESLPHRRCCGHGDLWCNNMFFQYSGTTPINCRLVDFQVLRYHHPAFDVLLCLHTNTRKIFRDNHLPELLEFYYQSLEDILKGYGQDPSKILPKEHFYKTSEIFKAMSIMQSICGRTVTFIPTEITNEAVTSGGDELGDILEDGRTKYVLEAYRKNELFKALMEEDLHDLYNYL